MQTLITQGRIITAEEEFTADVLIDGETISAVGPHLAAHPERTIDAAGLYVIPGGIDAHTHLDMPLGDIFSSDDFETGTRAAAMGGTTAVIDFATQSRGKPLEEALRTWQHKAQGKACIDYGFHMVLTDLPESRLPEMDALVQEGVTSFKMFMAYPGTLMADDAAIFRALVRSASNGSLLLIHAENGGVIDALTRQALAGGRTSPVNHGLTRPAKAEAEAVYRSICLAQMAGAPLYIVHLSTEDALKHVAEARALGQPVLAETCPQYLLLSADDLARPGFEGAKFVFTPPPRERFHQEKLWEGLRRGSLDVVSTDHCPFRFRDQKSLGMDDFTKIPNGGPGIEHRMQLLYDRGVNAGRLSLKRWVELTSTAPARIFGLYPRKGSILPGSDADIVLWDPLAEHVISASTHHMRVDYSMYEGFRIRGNAQTVFSRGEPIVENGNWAGRPGRGRFLRREATSPGRR